MNDRILSESQREYRSFFLEKLHNYGVYSPADLSKQQKSDFFSEIKRDWRDYKNKKKYINQSKREVPQLEKEKPKVTDNSDFSITKGKASSSDGTRTKVKKIDSAFIGKKIPIGERERLIESFTQVIKSEPNPEQRDDLKILYNPNGHFEQDDPYLYPVVKMPKQNTILKLPRIGRSNQKGFKEVHFFNLLKDNIKDIEMTTNVHLAIPNFSKPYEPDIVMFDKDLNLYIDIEIDEPYDGYFRYPTHNTHPYDEIKQDNIRDLFFNESGWIVIRFTEKQVHCQAQDCIDYIQNVLNSLYERKFTTVTTCQKEYQWDYNQCIQWQKVYYREKYLGIEGFQKRRCFREIEVDITEAESIEKIIQRTKRNYELSPTTNSIAFDEESHTYIHPNDETGNAKYISVTTLIERFFPFDLLRYINRKAVEENRTEEEVLDEYQFIRDEAADKGTYLHNQIENFLKKAEYDPNSEEFELFLAFYNREIVPRNLSFFAAEKVILSEKYNVAGTIDCLFKKTNKDEYVMVDWKRSKKLIIDGQPRIFGFGRALSELSSLDNSSYNRYCLQQNIYKYIIETEYDLRISSMKLVVLHENYSDYHVVDVPVMKKETDIILNSLKIKI